MFKKLYTPNITNNLNSHSYHIQWWQYEARFVSLDVLYELCRRNKGRKFSWLCISDTTTKLSKLPVQK